MLPRATSGGGKPRPYTPRLEGRPFYETISHMDATSLCRCDKCRKRIARAKNAADYLSAVEAVFAYLPMKEDGK